jgi:putative ABC transport system substrate-binding protein
MRRRDFTVGIASTALSWPLVARAEAAIRTVGFMSSRSADESASLVSAVRKGLQQSGFVEGRNIKVEYRWADGHYDRLEGLAQDLVQRNVAVIIAGGGAVSARAAKAATKTIPIAFVSGADPVKYGLVSSLSRPGGNATGVTMLVGELDTKRLELLRELIHEAALIAVLINPNSPEAAAQSDDMRAAAQAINQEIVILTAGRQQEFEIAFAELAKSKAEALLVANDPFFDSQRNRLVSLAAQSKVPTIWEWRPYVEAGGLMSYGADLSDMYRQAGVYAGRMLKGERPEDLPVERPIKIELLINMRAAHDIGLAIPQTLLYRADEVIE